MDAVQQIAKPYVHVLVNCLNDGRLWLNKSCEHYEAWQLISVTLGLTFLSAWVWNFIFGHDISKLYHDSSCHKYYVVCCYIVIQEFITIFVCITGLTKRIKTNFFKLVQSLPPVKNRLREELEKTCSEFEESFTSSTKGQNYVQCLPPRGLSKASGSNIT